MARLRSCTTEVMDTCRSHGGRIRPRFDAGSGVRLRPRLAPKERAPTWAALHASPGEKQLKTAGKPLKKGFSSARFASTLDLPRPWFGPLAGGSVRVLVTADTFSGVWTYARELVTGLVTQGAQVMLVSFGEIPLPDQTAWMQSLHGLEYHPTAFRLDWMQEGEQDFFAAQEYLCQIVRDTRPDILHLNQLSFGALPVPQPRVVTAHGDVITWWLTIHGKEPAHSEWLDWYRNTIVAGLKRAEAVATTTNWMAQMLRVAYGDEFSGHIISAGRNPIYFNPFVAKEELVLAIGRLWDSGKQVSLLTQHAHKLPVCIVGADNPIPAPALPIRADVKGFDGRHRDFGEGSADGIATAQSLQQIDGVCGHFPLRSDRPGLD